MEDKRKNLLFFETCRLCLDEQGYCDIFEKNDLLESIHTCIGVKVSLKDNLPQKICKKCLDIVESAAHLRKVALKNHHHLQSLFDVGESCIEPEHIEKPESTRSEYFENDNDTSSDQKNPAIQRFLAVRKDLYDSSVKEEPITDNKISQADSSQDRCKKRRYSHKEEKEENTENQCNECGKRFETAKKLYLHKRMHIKNYLCPIDICGKKFATKNDLSKHVRTHTGEKPYECDECGKGFAQSGTLKSHRETVHNFVM